MSLLLDTHVWIWTQESPESLGSTVRQRMREPAEALFVSTISTLEIARLLHGGLIDLQGDLALWIRESLDSFGCNTIELSHDIALAAYDLPPDFHKDPADRILAATARAHGLTLVTADERLLKCSCIRTLDART